MSTPSTVVLVVEDEPEIATQIARRLEAEGWRAHTVGDGQTGVSAAARLQPDLIVLDVMLPGIDGLEACRRIQAEATSGGRDRKSTRLNSSHVSISYAVFCLK